MSLEVFELESYAVSLTAGEAERQATVRPAATIHLRPKAEGPRADIYLRFYRPEAPVPPNSRVPLDGGACTYMVSFRLDQLANAVDLLRNEKPLFFKYDLKSEQGHLATSDEPVGEGEQDAAVAQSRRKPALPPRKA